MSQLTEGNVKTFTAGEALEAYRRVKYSSGTVMYADEGEYSIGITEHSCSSGAHVSVRLANAQGTRKVTAAGTFSQGAALYAADDGKVDDAAVGTTIGTALEAATAAGDVIEMIPHVGVQHINYDIIYGELLSGGTEQDIYEASNTQNYALETRRVTPDGEEWYYGKAGATINCDLAVWGYNTQHIAYTTVAETVEAGVTQVKLDVQATDGVGGDGAIAADELVGGRVVFFPHNSNSFVRKITDNTATTGAGEITLTLDKAIPVALTVDVSHGEAMASPYLDVRTGNCSGRRPFLGKADVAATVGQYFWIQKTGKTWLAPQGEVGVGDNDNEVVCRHDGSMDEHDYSDAYTTKAQHAGKVLTRASGETQGAPFIELQG